MVVSMKRKSSSNDTLFMKFRKCITDQLVEIRRPVTPVPCSPNVPRSSVPAANRYSTSQQVPSDLMSPQKSMNADCITELYRFLSFKEISQCAELDNTWSSSCSKRLFQSIADGRWVHRPTDMGMGASVAVDLDQQADWKRMVMCREELENVIAKESSVADKIWVITKFCERRLQDHVLLIEGMRWITEIFDKTVKGETNYKFPTPAVNKRFLQAVSYVLKEYRSVQWLQQLAAKCVGVLCIREGNRMYVDELKIGENLVGTLMYYVEQNCPKLMATALWAAVIICRPLGGVEGQTLTSFARENFANVSLVAKSGGVKVMFDCIRLYRSEPLVLAKAFWLVVNFALVDDVKQYMIDHGVIAHILDAMKAFPKSKEMQYRACFSLINIGIKVDAKQQIFDNDGLELVFKVMKCYPADPLFQRVGCNVIRSLMFGDVERQFVPAIVDMGGMEVLQAAEQRFQENTEVLGVISQTIFWLENF